MTGELKAVDTQGMSTERGLEGLQYTTLQDNLGS